MIVVTDTSVVLNLCWLRLESLLPAIYADVLSPGQVRLEFERKAAADSRFSGLRFPSFITLADPTAIPATLANNALGYLQASREVQPAGKTLLAEVRSIVDGTHHIQ